MTYDEILEGIDGLLAKLAPLEGFLDLADKRAQIGVIQDRMSQPNFWDDGEAANKVMAELKFLKSCVDPFLASQAKLRDLKELAEISKGETASLAEIERDLPALESEVEDIETRALLSGPFDRNNAIPQHQRRGPAAPSRATGPICCCACTPAGPRPMAAS